MQGQLRVGPARPARRPGAAERRSAYVVNDWQLSGIWTGRGRRERAEGNRSAERAYTVGSSYQNGGGNVNLTGSPDYGARVRVVGDPGSGCNGDRYGNSTRRRFKGPLIGSVGLESGNGYLKGAPSACSTCRSPATSAGRGPDVQLRSTCSTRQTGRHHRPEYDDEPDEPDGSGDRQQPAVRCRTAPGARARIRAGRLRRGQRLSGPRTVQLQVRFSF